MKNFVKIILVLCFILQEITVQSQENAIFNQANKAYMQKDYPTAIRLNSDIISAGNVSADVNYNLGNAYFKNNQLSNAILWYERALRIDPSNEDIIHNIAFANSRITDEMEIMPVFFLNRWFKNMYSLLSSTAWAVASIVLCVCLFLLVVILCLSLSVKRRIFLFFASIAMFLFLAMSYHFCLYATQTVHAKRRTHYHAYECSRKKHARQSGNRFVYGTRRIKSTTYG
jgi:tetratricopeptide (TPR) repeat protein